MIVVGNHISKLKSKSPDIRKASILSLMQLKSKESLKQLKYLLEVENDNNLIKIIQLAIKQINE